MSRYSLSRTKRLLDIVLSTTALVLLSPLFALIAAAVVLEDGFPCLFRQKRIGQGGRIFTILKFRSMRSGSSGSRITAARDTRITGVGAILRSTKLDELPQFWNILRGDMSLTGPRPEDPAFVDGSNPAWSLILQARPGLTDFASLVYRHEEQVLANSQDVEKQYAEFVLPDKLGLSCEFLKRNSFWLDLRVLALTFWYAIRPHDTDNNRLRKLFLN